MAVTIKTGGAFVKEDGQRPGMYVRFVETAIASIGVGARSKVATIKKKPTGETTTPSVYRITGMGQAAEIFGADILDIQDIFKGGASEVIVGTVPATAAAAADYTKALQMIETYDYHVYVTHKGSDDPTDQIVSTWVTTNQTNGKEFIAVYSFKGDEKVIADIASKSSTVKNEAAVYVANGPTDADGIAIKAEDYAFYIAGLIAGTALDGSLTYFEVPYGGVTTRYRATEIKDLLAANVLVTVPTSNGAKIEQGLTLGEGKFAKIRTVRAKQAMVDDIDKAVNDNYVGKITNNADGQIAVINAIKTYLQTLAQGNIIDSEFTVELDKEVPSVGDELYINIAVRFLDSIEYVYLTITV